MSTRSRISDQAKRRSSANPWVFAFVVSCAFHFGAAQDAFVESIEPVFREHCVRCHGEGDKVKGKVDLLAVNGTADLAADPDLVGAILDALDFEEMPPEDEPPVPPEKKAKLVAALEAILRASVSGTRQFSRAPVRRMNRFQYHNAVTDLFELDAVVFPLPERILREYDGYFQPASRVMPDAVKVGCRPLGKSQLIEPRRLAGVAPFPQDLRAEHGFDNRGDHLTLSPLLMESFLRLSRSIVESPDFEAKNVGIWREFFAEPEGEGDRGAVVRDRLRPILTRAFRAPVEEDRLDRYSAHVLARIESGDPFPVAMKSAAAAVIASPGFLYLYDRGIGDDASGGHADGYDLASRLSFFLWGSLPDGELLRLAESGDLADPDILAAQVERMMNDRKLKRFCDSFPSQWLQLDRIISSRPDREEFPEFYFSKYLASMHMVLEPLLLFETVLVEDRSILDLIDPDFSYRSTMLDEHYGVDRPGKKGQVTTIPFERVSLRDRREGGVITNAAVMTMTSGPDHTKPITRGAWLASAIFHNPPEPPPADVPPLPEHPSEEEKDFTLRERLVAHREREDCAGCHEKIDPLGFALENYGPTGKWRDVYENGREVDMQGTLFRQHEFGDVVAFKDAILEEKDRFAHGFAAHLLSFALARELDAADHLAVDAVVERVAGEGYRMRSLVRELVLSEPFLGKGSSNQ